MKFGWVGFGCVSLGVLKGGVSKVLWANVFQRRVSGESVFYGCEKSGMWLKCSERILKKKS